MSDDIAALRADAEKAAYIGLAYLLPPSTFLALLDRLAEAEAVNDQLDGVRKDRDAEIDELKSRLAAAETAISTFYTEQDREDLATELTTKLAAAEAKTEDAFAALRITKEELAVAQELLSEWSEEGRKHIARLREIDALNKRLEAAEDERARVVRQVITDQGKLADIIYAAEKERDEARATVDAAILRDVEKDATLAAAQARIAELEAEVRTAAENALIEAEQLYHTIPRLTDEQLNHLHSKPIGSGTIAYMEARAYNTYHSEILGLIQKYRALAKTDKEPTP